MATLGSRMVNEPSPITTEPTDFALQGHRPCQHCGYDLVGTPIERAVDLEIAMIRCPECGNLNPLIGTPPLGPFAQRAAMVGTLVRLLLIGLTSIILWTVAFNSVEEWGKSMYRSQANQGLMAFFQSNGDTPEEQQALEVGREDDATLGEVITVLKLYQKRTDSKYDFGELFQSQITPLLTVVFILGVVWSLLLLPQRWIRAAVAAVVVGMLAAGAGVASLFASKPLDLLVKDLPMAAYDPDRLPSFVAESGMERLFAFHGAGLVVITLVISNVLARPLTRGAFRLLVPLEHLSGVEVLWKADGLPMPSPTPCKDQPTVES